jgi:hypothetical protein
MRKLIIQNLKEFFFIGFDNQFNILAELESQINEKQEIQDVVFIEYKTDKDCIFRLKKIEYKERVEVFTYVYESTIS